MTKNMNYPSSKYHEKGEKFTHRHPIIPSIGIYNALKLMSINFRGETAINCLNLDVTYQELINDAVMFSKAFKELGIKKGDIITICMDNIYHVIAAFLAGNRIGAIVTNLNSQSTVEEQMYYLNDFESPLFIHMNKGKDYNDKISKNTKVQNIISLDEREIQHRDFSSEINHGYQNNISFREIKSIASYQKKLSINHVTGNDDALILFTSGSTTGIPKSVVITNKNILASGIYMKNSCNLKVKKGEKSLVCVPFAYPYGFCTSALMSLLCGRQAILTPMLNRENIKYYYKKGPNYIFGSPALLELTKRFIPKEQDLSSCKYFISGGDFLYENQIKEGKAFFQEHGANIEMCNGSGNAECTGATTNAVGVPYKKGTVGKILVGTNAICINPDTKEEVPYGEEGELYIGGEHVFKKYFKADDLTKEAKIVYKGKVYINTGTIGIIDKEGYYTLLRRTSRFYINGDLNKVYLEKIQKVISLIDGVDSCIAVPKPNDEILFDCKIFVVPSKNVIPDETFINYLKEQFNKTFIDENGKVVQLKYFEIPKSIELLNELPRNAKKGDKVDIILLEKNAIEEYEKEKNQKLSRTKTLV